MYQRLVSAGTLLSVPHEVWSQPSLLVFAGVFGGGVVG